MAQGTESIFHFVKQNPYSGYVLLLLTTVYLLNQVDRYLFSADIAEPPFVTKHQVGLITGPLFTVLYTITGVFISFFGSLWNRKIVLTISLIFWSLMTILTGFTDKFWQVAITRIGQSIGEAGCTPFAAGLISDYFPPAVKGTAMSFYNVGIYTGFSLSQSAANQIKSHIGWKAAYFIWGGIGIGVALLLIFTLKEPKRRLASSAVATPGSHVKDLAMVAPSYKEIFFHWVASPSLILFCIAGGVRNAGGYVWAYYSSKWFKSYRHVSDDTYSAYMSWIPLVGGSLGAIFGGLISDRLIKRKRADGTTLGPVGRVVVVMVSNVLAAPFGYLALTIHNPTAPGAFLCLIGTNVIGEMWIGVTLALILDLTPKNMHTTSIAIYLFIITNIGGNFPALVPALESYIGGPHRLRWALMILYPGVYAASSVFFLFALFFLNRDIRRAKAAEEKAKLSGFASEDVHADDDGPSTSFVRLSSGDKEESERPLLSSEGPQTRF